MAAAPTSRGLDVFAQWLNKDEMALLPKYLEEKGEFLASVIRVELSKMLAASQAKAETEAAAEAARLRKEQAEASGKEPVEDGGAEDAENAEKEEEEEEEDASSKEVTSETVVGSLLLEAAKIKLRLPHVRLTTLALIRSSARGSSRRRRAPLA